MRQTISDFSASNQLLEQFMTNTPRSGTYTLDTMRQLMEYLGNPQDELKIIHVAGTSGKTSTSYFLANLLHTAGYIVGLTVSPHIDSVGERAQINMHSLPPGEFHTMLSEFIQLVTASTLHPSYFELMVAFAYWLFHKKSVEYAVVEVGLGGLLDATNVVSRTDKVCVITDIGLDHVDILGTTLPEIAVQKAGIIQQNNRVFMYQQGDDVTEVVRQIATEKNAKLTLLQLSPAVVNVAISFLALFQQRNFNLALTTVQSVLRQASTPLLTDLQIQKASTLQVPARMEIVQYQDKTFILDGSHNEQKIRALISSVRARYPTDSIALLVSFGANKRPDIVKNLVALHTITSTIVITRFGSAQDEVRTAIDPSELAAVAKDLGFETIHIEPSPAKALEILQMCNADIYLVTGSFYLLNHIRPIVMKSSAIQT